MADKSPRLRLSEEERVERRCADRERLKRVAEELPSTEGWKRWYRIWLGRDPQRGAGRHEVMGG